MPRSKPNLERVSGADLSLYKHDYRCFIDGTGAPSGTNRDTTFRRHNAHRFVDRGGVCSSSFEIIASRAEYHGARSLFFPQAIPLGQMDQLSSFFALRRSRNFPKGYPRCYDSRPSVSSSTSFPTSFSSCASFSSRDFFHAERRASLFRSLTYRAVRASTYSRCE